MRVVDNHQAVLNDGDAWTFSHFSGIVEAGGSEDDIVGLPFKGWFTGVDERGELVVNCAAIPIPGTSIPRSPELGLRICLGGTHRCCLLPVPLLRAYPGI